MTRRGLQIETAPELIVCATVAMESGGVQRGVLALVEIRLTCDCGGAAEALDVTVLQGEAVPIAFTGKRRKLFKILFN